MGYYKKSIKRYIAKYINILLYISGFSWFLMKIRNNFKVVLLYHRVNTRKVIESHYLKSIFVDKENFKRQLKYIAYRAKNSIIITFDDGYLDNYNYALSELERYNLKAIFFISTGFVNKQYFQWIDILTSYAKANNWSYLDFEKISRKIKAMNKKERDNYIFGICSSTIFLSDDLPMDWFQIKVLAEHGHEIGNHTINHVIFSNEILKDIIHEIVVAQKDIMDSAGVECKKFAYPNGDIGRSDEISNITEILREYGYEYAFTTQRGEWKAKDNPYFIKRIPIYYWDCFAAFVNKTRGIDIEDNLSLKAILSNILSIIGLKNCIKKILKY